MENKNSNIGLIISGVIKLIISVLLICLCGYFFLTISKYYTLIEDVVTIRTVLINSYRIIMFFVIAFLGIYIIHNIFLLKDKKYIKRSLLIEMILNIITSIPFFILLAECISIVAEFGYSGYSAYFYCFALLYLILFIINFGFSIHILIKNKEDSNGELMNLKKVKYIMMFSLINIIINAYLFSRFWNVVIGALKI